jgi:hypothetical protein
VLITNHVLAGALVGAVSPGPVAAFGLGIASHFAMDVVPHWGNDDVFLKVAVVDGLVGLVTMGYIARRTSAEQRTRVVAGMLGACVPDSDKPSELFFGRSPFPAALDQWHGDIQHESTRRMPQEFAVATVGLLAVRALVLRRASR